MPKTVATDECLLDLQIFATCGHLRLWDTTQRGWAVAYKSQHINLIIGYGCSPSAALDDCYRRVLDEMQRAGAGINDRDRDDGLPQRNNK